MVNDLVNWRTWFLLHLNCLKQMVILNATFKYFKVFFTIHYIKKQFKLCLLYCSRSSTDTDSVKYNTKKYTF